MPKYIDADGLKQYVNDLSTNSLNGWSTLGILGAIDALPAADVASVVHGRWIQMKTSIGKTYSVCSCCKTDFKFKTDKGTLARLDMNGTNYCPNCGAKMDKEDEI